MEVKALLKIIGNIVLCIISLLFFLNLFTGTLYFVMSLLKKKGDVNVGQDSPTATTYYEYQTLEYDPNLKETTSLGMIEVFYPIEGDSEFSQKPNGNYMLVSKIGTEEYECTGFCYCENEQRRSVTTTTLRKPLFYLVGAFSSAIAYEQAKEYFEKDCGSESNDDLTDEHICRSEVEECREAVPTAPRRIRTPTEGENLEGLEERTYRCKGYCKPIESYRKYVVSSKYFHTHDIPVRCYSAFKSDNSLGTKIYVPPDTSPQESEKLAEEKFFSTDLDHFCIAHTNLRDIDLETDEWIRKYEFGWRDSLAVDEDAYNYYKGMRHYILSYKEWYKEKGFTDQKDTREEFFSVCSGDVKHITCRKIKEMKDFY